MFLPVVRAGQRALVLLVALVEELLYRWCGKSFRLGARELAGSSVGFVRQ